MLGTREAVGPFELRRDPGTAWLYLGQRFGRDPGIFERFEQGSGEFETRTFRVKRKLVESKAGLTAKNYPVLLVDYCTSTKAFCVLPTSWLLARWVVAWRMELTGFGRRGAICGAEPSEILQPAASHELGCRVPKKAKSLFQAE